MRAVRAYGEGWCVYRIAGGVSASATGAPQTIVAPLGLGRGAPQTIIAPLGRNPRGYTDY